MRFARQHVSNSIYSALREVLMPLNPPKIHILGPGPCTYLHHWSFHRSLCGGGIPASGVEYGHGSYMYWVDSAELGLRKNISRVLPSTRMVKGKGSRGRHTPWPLLYLRCSGTPPCNIPPLTRCDGGISPPAPGGTEVLQPSLTIIPYTRGSMYKLSGRDCICLK